MTYFGTNLPPSISLMKSGFSLVGQDLADARMFLDIGPFGDQEEARRVVGVAAQHPVLHLGGRLVHRVAVRIVELLEQPDEFLLAPG